MIVRYETPKGPTRPLLMLCGMLALQGCVAAGPILTTRAACSSLLPNEWREGVPGAPLPDGYTMGDWIAFGDAQTGQLDKANDRTTSSIGIIERCEERDKQAIQKAKPKFLGIF